MAEDRKKRGDLGKKKSKSKKPTHHASEIHLRRAHSGELLAKHKFASKMGEPSMEDEEHVLSPDQLQDHVETHLPPPSSLSEQGGQPSAATMGGM